MSSFAERLRTTAQHMREDHQPPHPRSEMWSALAVWMESAAGTLEAGTHPFPSAPLRVAEEYEKARVPQPSDEQQSSRWQG